MAGGTLNPFAVRKPHEDVMCCHLNLLLGSGTRGSREEQHTANGCMVIAVEPTSLALRDAVLFREAQRAEFFLSMGKFKEAPAARHCALWLFPDARFS